MIVVGLYGYRYQHEGVEEELEFTLLLRLAAVTKPRQAWT